MSVAIVQKERLKTKLNFVNNQLDLDMKEKNRGQEKRTGMFYLYIKGHFRLLLTGKNSN
jgi:hypothetical protein